MVLRCNRRDRPWMREAGVPSLTARTAFDPPFDTPPKFPSLRIGIGLCVIRVCGGPSARAMVAPGEYRPRPGLQHLPAIVRLYHRRPPDCGCGLHPPTLVVPPHAPKRPSGAGHMADRGDPEENSGLGKTVGMLKEG